MCLFLYGMPFIPFPCTYPTDRVSRVCAPGYYDYVCCFFSSSSSSSFLNYTIINHKRWYYSNEQRDTATLATLWMVAVWPVHEFRLAMPLWLVRRASFALGHLLDAAMLTYRRHISSGEPVQRWSEQQYRIGDHRYTSHFACHSIFPKHSCTIPNAIAGCFTPALSPALSCRLTSRLTV